MIFYFKRDSIFINWKGESDNGNQLYLHYKYDSSNLSFSNFILIKDRLKIYNKYKIKPRLLSGQSAILKI